MTASSDKHYSGQCRPREDECGPRIPSKRSGERNMVGSGGGSTGENWMETVVGGLISHVSVSLVNNVDCICCLILPDIKHGMHILAITATVARSHPCFMALSLCSVLYYDSRPHLFHYLPFPVIIVVCTLLPNYTG